MDTWQYKYPAEVIRVIDGDTIVVKIDLGFHINIIKHVRVYGINTPELKGLSRKKGEDAKSFVEELLPVGKEVVIESVVESDVYGRLVADVIVDEMSLSEILLEEGHGKPFMLSVLSIEEGKFSSYKKKIVDTFNYIFDQIYIR